MAIVSCADQGCIDADDFGEYESETIEVNANSSQDQCNYDPNKPLDEPQYQGSGIITCLATGSSTVIDQNGDSYTTDSKGCMGFEEQQEPVAMQLCIDACMQKCTMSLSSGGNKAEPNWTSTNKRSSNMNYGVTIRPGSQVYIRAIGDIYLGDQANYPNIYVKADEYRPDSFDKDWEKTFFDVRNQQSLTMKFSGEWDNNSNSSDGVLGGGSQSISSNGNSASDVELYNGARRFIAYLIPHKDGYSFDSSAESEEEGSVNVPLWADSRAWKCKYSGSGPQNITQVSCDNDEKGYTNNGYTKVDDKLASELFPISSEVLKSGVGEYGGIIRWDVDGIGEMDNNYDPFSGITPCTTASCDISGVKAEEGRMLGDLSTNVEIFNPSEEDSYKVSFRSIESSGSCNTELLARNPDISVYVVDKTNNPVHEYENPINSNYIAKNLNILSGSWTAEPITIEPGQKIIVSSSGIRADCGKVIAVKLLKYHDIKITNSGFVSFSTLDALSGNCTINARIVNPEGSHSKAMFSGEYNNSSAYEADFYEYGNFSTNLLDPLQNLSVSPRATGNTGWTNPVFLRKGQIIRFSPESWNGTFSTNAGTRKCGIGMAMKIDPRPALLCRGKSSATNSDYINNPNCYFDYALESSGNITGGDLLGCKENAQICDDESTNLYCPNTECQKEIINCVNANVSNNEFAKTGCAIKSSYTSISFTDENGASQTLSCDTSSSNVTNGNCGRCDTARLNNSMTPAKIAISNLDKCYDLENYKGKVKNISATSGFSSAELSDTNISKGATIVPFFNGSYGNFDNYYDTKSAEGSGDSNIVFEVKDPLLFSRSGRLKFLMLDGNDFNGSQGSRLAYNNNSSALSNYNYQNGFKVTFSGLLNFSNGQWLQAILCKESSDGSIDCKSTSPSELTSNPSQPDLVKIDLSNSTSTTPKITSPYKFDDYGNLVRIQSPSSIDCKLNSHGVETTSDAFFYCHTYQFYNKTDFESLSDSNKDQVTKDIEKLRLSFKIIDPEINNCNLENGQRNTGTNTGIIVKNAYYDSSDSNNTGKSCDPSVKAPGPDSNDCHYELVCVNKYSNNKGKYYVNVKVKSEGSNGISNMIGSVINPIVEVMDGTKKNCSVSGNSIFFDGTKTKNSSFDRDANPGNIGQTCTGLETLCNKEFICEEAKIGQAERVYKLLISDYRYKSILTLSLVLMFTFYGLGYLMGVSELSHAELVNRIIKIGLIYLFIGETGWDWFNDIVVNFFKGGSDYLAFLMASSFDDSAEIQNAINNSDFYDKSVLFSSVDRVFGMFFSDAVLKKISALLFASIFGWAYLLIIIFSFVLYVSAVANAVLLYLTAQVFTSILFTLGPIFFIFTLFGPTKEMFDNWLKSLIGFSLQQILLLITLAFFNMLMYEVIKMSLGYKICWDEVWTINIITRISLLSFWTIASLPPRTNAQSGPGEFGNPDGIPSLFSILFIWVIASLMNKFIGFMVGLASDISGGISASKMASGVVAAGNQLKGMAKSKAGEAWKAVGGEEMMQRADQAMFDSGALADKERDKQKLQNRKDSQEKAQLAKGGKTAVAEFKKENQAKLASMSKAEQQVTLNKVKDSGEKAMGKKMGLDDKRISDLQKSQGFQSYHDSNIVGAAVHYGRQAVGGAISGDSTISKSLVNQDAQTSFSKSEAVAGLKNMTPEQRDAVKESNNIEISRSTSDKAGKLMSQAGGAVSSAASSTYKATKTLAKAATGDEKAIKEVKEAPGKAMSTASEAASEISSAVYKAPSQVASAVSQGASQVSSAISQGANDRKEAISQLEKEGEINKVMKGTDFLRDKEEKNKISARMAENKKQKSVNTKKPTNSDINGQVALEKEINQQNLGEELSNIASDSSLSKEEKRTKSNEVRENRKIDPDTIKEKLENKYKADIKSETDNTNKTLDKLAGAREFDAEKGEFKKEATSKDGKVKSARKGGKMGILKDKLAKVNAEKDEYLQTDEGKDYAEKVEGFEAKIADPKASASEKKTAEKNLKATKNSNAKMHGYEKQEEKISAEIHDTQRQIDNYSEKLDNLGYDEKEEEKEKMRESKVDSKSDKVSAEKPVKAPEFTPTKLDSIPKESEDEDEDEDETLAMENPTEDSDSNSDSETTNPEVKETNTTSRRSAATKQAKKDILKKLNSKPSPVAEDNSTTENNSEEGEATDEGSIEAEDEKPSPAKIMKDVNSNLANQRNKSKESADKISRRKKPSPENNDAE